MISLNTTNSNSLWELPNCLYFLSFL